MQNYFDVNMLLITHTFFLSNLIHSQSDIPQEIREGRRAPSIPPSTFHRAQYKEQHSFISTDYTKLPHCYNSTTEHMLNFLCIHKVPVSNKARQYSLQYFLTYQDNKEPRKLSNRWLLLRCVFNNRRTNLIN